MDERSLSPGLPGARPMTEPVARASRPRVFDRYHGLARDLFDAARQHSLLGRDRALGMLLERPWQTLVEIGPGTGRGSSGSLDLSGFYGSPPDRVLLSYCLSAIPEPAAAVATIRAQLAARSELWVVDFADGAGLPPLVRKPLHRWLAAFQVRPLHASVLAEAASVEFGFARCYAIARFRGTRRARIVPVAFLSSSRGHLVSSSACGARGGTSISARSSGPGLR